MSTREDFKNQLMLIRKKLDKKMKKQKLEKQIAKDEKLLENVRKQIEQLQRREKSLVKSIYNSHQLLLYSICS